MPNETTPGHYWLYDSKLEQRFIITPEIMGSEQSSHITGTFAESWLDAKQRLGFELTPVQKELLAAQGIPLIVAPNA